MNAEAAQMLMRLLEGYWPTPELKDAEAAVWLRELTNPDFAIEPAEAAEELRAMALEGVEHRPRVGQLVKAVRARRKREWRPALAVVDDEDWAAIAAPWLPEIRAAAIAGGKNVRERWGRHERASYANRFAYGSGHIAATLADWLPYNADDPAEWWNGGGESDASSRIVTQSQKPDDDGPLEMRSREAT
jgi:hypothetical protein